MSKSNINENKDELNLDDDDTHISLDNNDNLLVVEESIQAVASQAATTTMSKKSTTTETTPDVAPAAAAQQQEQVESTWEQLMGKDLLMKSIYEPPLNDSIPVQVQSAVVVDFVGWYSPLCPLYHPVSSDSYKDNNDDNVFQIANDWLIVIGEKDVIPVLEMGIRFMKKGQICLLWGHSKFAYGPSGRKYNNNTQNENNNKILQPNSNIMYRIIVKDIIDGIQLDDNNFKLKLCESKKNIANDIFNYELCIDTTYGKGRAIMMYKRSADMLEYMIQQATKQQQKSDKLSDENANEEEEQEVEVVQNDVDTDYLNFNIKYATELYLDCLNNITAVYMISKDYHLAKEAAIHVLTRDPFNLKGLIRAAKASLLDPASSFEEVNQSIQAAIDTINTISSSPPDPKSLIEITKLQNDLYIKKKQYKEQQKQISSNITKGLQKSNNSKNVGTTNTTTTTIKKNEKQSKYNLQHDDTLEKDNVNFNTKNSTTNVITSNSSTEQHQLNSNNTNFLIMLWKRTNDYIQQNPDIKNMIVMYGFQIISIFIMIWYFRPSSSQSRKNNTTIQQQSSSSSHDEGLHVNEEM